MHIKIIKCLLFLKFVSEMGDMVETKMINNNHFRNK